MVNRDEVERLAKLVSDKIDVVELAPGLFRFDPGSNVICDGCSEDWTDRPEAGGVYGLETKAFCPDCAPGIETLVQRYGEEDHIYARCPPDKSFADWVRDDLRG